MRIDLPVIVGWIMLSYNRLGQIDVQQLMEELASTENRIAFSRQFYNAIESVPTNMVASVFNFRHATYFELETGSARSPPSTSARSAISRKRPTG